MGSEEPRADSRGSEGQDSGLSTPLAAAPRAQDPDIEAALEALNGNPISDGQRQRVRSHSGYDGRRFKNDTERLEKLFDLYTKMMAKPGTAKQAKAAPTKRAARKAAA